MRSPISSGRSSASSPSSVAPSSSGSPSPTSKCAASGRSTPAMDEAARDAMLAAVDQYNRGDYLPAQEALENLFNTLPAEDQPLVRSLMTLATAMHLHFR